MISLSLLLNKKLDIFFLPDSIEIIWFGLIHYSAFSAAKAM